MIRRILRRIYRPIRRSREVLWAVMIYWRRYGLIQLVLKCLSVVASPSKALMFRRAYNIAAYRRWIQNNEPSKLRLAEQSAHHFRLEPQISLLVPCYQTPLPFLKALIKSVQVQTYSNWQLCLAVVDDMPHASMEYLSQIAASEERIKLVILSTNKGIGANTAAAMAVAGGELVGFIDHDDTIAPFALFEVISALNDTPESDLFYSDEDKITEDGSKRHTPHFKPDWSPDLLRSYNYITHFLVIQRTLIDQVGGISTRFDGCQDYDLTLRTSEQAKRITHIPKVLYHWRQHPGSTSINTEAKPEVTRVSELVVAEHLKRVGRLGSVSPGPFFGAVNIHYELVDKPLVSIIIPNHDHAEDLNLCIASIKDKTMYPNYEIVVMENHSQQAETFRLYEKLKNQGVRVVNWEKQFNYSEINNDGAIEARGDILLFLNNDVAIISPDWIEAMLMHLQHKEVGAVGAKLYFDDQTIQHAGVILGIGGVAGHSHKGFLRSDPGYFGRLQVVQNFSAVTGACLMVKRTVFEQVGGLDTKLPIAFNDIDFCLKIRAAGYLIVWTPQAELFHFESKTRGYEDTRHKQERFLREIDYFNGKWSDTLKAGDPYYSPNLTLNAEDFSINA